MIPKVHVHPFVTGLVALLVAAVAPAAAPRTAQTTQFRAGVDLVEVDVSVVDRNGRPVVDLTAADFELREEGRLQTIDLVYLATLDRALLAAPPGPADSPAPPAGPALPARRALTQRVFVFVLDMPHLSASGFTRARRALDDFLASGLTPADVAGIVARGRMLGSRLETDKAALRRALAAVDGPNLARFNEMRTFPRLVDTAEAVGIARNDKVLLDRATRRGCSERPGECGSAGGDEAVRIEVENKARRIASEALRDAQATLLELQTLATSLGRVPGPKHVVVFSEGFYTENITEWMQRVVGQAARHGVRFSTIDARGIGRDPASSNLIGGEQPLTAPGDFALTGADTDADTLTSLALDTGGMLVRNQNNFGPALEALARETGTYYVLGYRPTLEPDDGYRRIEVKVTRPGLTVRARRGYVASRQPADTAPRVETVPPAPPAAAPTAGIVEPPVATAAVTAPPPAPDADAVLRRTETIERLTTLLADRPEPVTVSSPEAARLAREGWNRYARGDVEGAQERLAAAVATGRASTWVYAALGQAEFALGRYAEAVTAWQHVLRDAPDYQPNYFDLVDGYLQLDREGDALAVLREALKRWPEDAEVHNALGVVLVRRDALDDAVRAFERATVVAPEDALGFFNLGRAHHLRYVRLLRTIGASTNPVARSVADRDRQRALDAYRRCLEIGGPWDTQAREAIALLDWR